MLECVGACACDTLIGVCVGVVVCMDNMGDVVRDWGLFRFFVPVPDLILVDIVPRL